MRRDRAAGVLVRVDQRRQRAGGAQDRVQVEAQLADDVVVGPETGRVHHRVRDDPPLAGGQLHAAVGGLLDGLDPEAADQLDPAGLHQVLQPGAERTAGRELVGGAAAVGAGLVGAAHHPDDLGARRLLGQVAQIQQRGRRRVPGANDRRTAAGEAVTVAAQDIGQRVRDAWAAAFSPRAGMPEPPSTLGRRQVPAASTTAEASSSEPSARRIRNGAFSRPAVRIRSNPTRVTATTAASYWILSLSCASLDQRCEVGVDQVAAGRQSVEVGFAPAAGVLQQAPGRRVDVVAPRAEQLHVRAIR